MREKGLSPPPVSLLIMKLVRKKTKAKCILAFIIFNISKEVRV